MLVESIMSLGVHTLAPDNTLGDVRKIFTQVAYHHLLVQEGNKLVGLVSDRDMLRNLSPFIASSQEREQDGALLQKPVAQIMTSKLITVDRRTTIDCATILLLENNISCLPVVSAENKIEGILTWKDILKYHVYT